MIAEIFVTGFILFAIGFSIYMFYLKFLREKLFEDVLHYTEEGKPDYIEKRRKYELNIFKPKKKEGNDLIEKIKNRMRYDINKLGLSIEETKQKLIKEGWKKKTVRRAIKKLKMEIKENGLKTEIKGFAEKEESIPKPPTPRTSTTTDSGTTTSSNRDTQPITPGTSAGTSTNRFERRNDSRTNRFNITR